MTAGLPHIPENAPFSPQQREWLNGFLAGLFSNTALKPVPVAKTESVKVAVYFATQSGTAERLAKKLTKELKGLGHAVSLSSLEKKLPVDLAQQENALFLVSTYGDGDPPESAKEFRDALFTAASPAMTHLRYSVFCLGDRHYENFCRFGVDLDERLGNLGGRRFCARIESDIDVDEPFAEWVKTISLRLTEKRVTAPAAEVAQRSTTIVSTEPGATHTRDNPYFAELRERRSLTADGSTKVTMHLSFARDGALAYEAGDACGVVAENDPVLVGEILSLLPFGGDAMVELPKVGRVSVEQALLRYLQPTRLTRKIVQAFADKTQCHELKALLPAEQGAHLEAFIHGRGLIDLLEIYRDAVEFPEELAAMLPKLAPRLYSISSSPKTHADQVHCTVAVVRYRTHNRERSGVASTMLESRLGVGEKLPIYIQPNKRFRIPTDGNVPMIMVGPGTGIAPFRAFLHERRALEHKGSNWLFFGERSAKTDFLYEPELQEMNASGHLTRLDTAFSRDQGHKVYVQDRMVEQGAEMWRWLQDGAQVYVCGDASRMSKDVDSALHSVVEKHGSMSADAAREYVAQLHEDKRYHRDVY